MFDIYRVLIIWCLNKNKFTETSLRFHGFEGDDKTDVFHVLVFCNSGKYQWLKIDTFVHFIGMTATDRECVKTQIQKHKVWNQNRFTSFLLNMWDL